MLTDAKERARGVGADILVRASSTQTGVSLSADSLPEKYVSYFRSDVPHVKLALGVINHSIDFPLIITGLNLDEFNSMSGGFTYTAGHGLRGPDDILVDTLYARQKKLRIGSTITLLNHNWRLVGIIEGGKLARVVASLETLQQVLDTGAKVTSIYLKLDDPANIDAVVRFISDNTSLQAKPMQEYTEATYNVNNIPGLSEFMYVVMGIGVVIGFAVVCLSMYMAVLQRTREIGILKSLGGSNGFHPAHRPGGSHGAGHRRHRPRHPDEFRRVVADPHAGAVIPANDDCPFMVAHRRRHHAGGSGPGRAVSRA